MSTVPDSNLSQPVSLPKLAPGEPEPVWEIATMFDPQGTWTEAQYLDFTDSTNRIIEFTHGRLEFLAMPSVLHQRIVKFLFRLLDDFVIAKALGEVLPGGIRVRTSDEKFRIPDVIYLANSDQEEWFGDRFFRGASLAIEVVSDDPNSHERDYTTKTADYAEARIPEYWIVDPQEQLITVLTLEKTGTSYREQGTYRAGETVRSELLSGFEVTVEAVFAAGKSPKKPT